MLDLDLILGRFWDPKWTPKWDLKSFKNLPWAAQGPPGTPTAARRPPWGYFGTFWGQFSKHVGAIWDHFGTIFHLQHSSYVPLL